MKKTLKKQQKLLVFLFTQKTEKNLKKSKKYVDKIKTVEYNKKAFIQESKKTIQKRIKIKFLS